MKACQICLSIYEDGVKFCPFHGVELKPVPGTIFNSGDTVANYYLRSQIGRDGLGDIFCASRDQNTYRLRIFNEGVLLNSKRFSHLQQILEQSTHISGGGIPVVDFGMIGGGDFFCAHPYIPGRSFQEIIDLNQNLSESEIAILLNQLLRSVRDIHAQRMIHGGMSLKTTIVDNAGHVRLYDTGLWDILRDEHFAELCEDHADVLSDIIDLMAPEVAQGSEPQAYSDVYSCGAAAYCLLTRQAGSGSADYRYRMHYDGITKDIRSGLHISVNQDFIDLIMAAMNSDSNVRFQNPKPFMTALRSVHEAIDPQAESLPQSLAQKLLSGAEKPVSSQNRALAGRSHTINDTHLDTHTPFDTHRFDQTPDLSRSTDTTQRIIPKSDDLQFADTVVDQVPAFADTVVDNTKRNDLSSLIGDSLGKDDIFDDLERALTTELDPFESQPTQEIPQPLFTAPQQSKQKSAEDIFSGLLNQSLSEKATKPQQTSGAEAASIPAKSPDEKAKADDKSAVEAAKAEAKPEPAKAEPKQESAEPAAKSSGEAPKEISRGDIVSLPNNKDMRRLKRRRRRDINDVEPKNEVVIADTVIPPMCDPSKKPSYSKLPTLTVTNGFHFEDGEVIEEDVLPHMLGIEHPSNPENKPVQAAAAEPAAAEQTGVPDMAIGNMVTQPTLEPVAAEPQEDKSDAAEASGDNDIVAGFFDADGDSEDNAENDNMDWFGEEPLALKPKSNKSRYIKIAAIALALIVLAGVGYAIVQSGSGEQTDAPDKQWTQKIADFKQALAQKTPESRETAKSLFGEIRKAPLDQKTIQECRENYISSLKSQADEIKSGAKSADDIVDPLDLTNVYDTIQNQYFECVQKIDENAPDLEEQKQGCLDVENTAKDVAQKQAVAQALQLKPEYESQLSKWSEIESIYQDISAQMRGNHDAAVADAMNTASIEKDNYSTRLNALKDKSGDAQEAAIAANVPDNTENAGADDAGANGANEAAAPADTLVAANDPANQAAVQPIEPAEPAVPAVVEPQPAATPEPSQVVAKVDPVVAAPAEKPSMRVDDPEPAAPAADTGKPQDGTESAVLNNAANNKKNVLLVDDDPAPVVASNTNNNNNNNNKRIMLVDDDDDLAPIAVPAKKKDTTDDTKSSAVDNKDKTTAKDTKDTAADNKDKTTAKDTAKPAETKPAETKPAETPKSDSAQAGNSDKVPTGKLIADAQTAMGKRDFDTAVQLLMLATTQEPKNYRAWFSLAKANEGRGKIDIAISNAEKACKIQRTAGCYVYVGDLYRKSGDQAGAKKAYEEAIAIDPNNAAAKSRLQ